MEGKRRRKLPPELVTWLVIGMGLYRWLKIESVLARVADSVGGVFWGPAELPHCTSITQARDRLGWRVVRTLFQRLVARLRADTAAATSWRGHEVYTLDGTCFLVPDTPENERVFTRPSVTRGGTSGFPQLRALLLVGAWTHLVVDVVLGPYAVNEMRFVEHLLERLRPGTVLLLDRAYYGFRWPAEFLTRGVHFVVRMKQGGKAYRVKRGRRLGNGDWLCEMRRPKHCANPKLPDVLQARLIKCTRRGFRPIYVLTSLVSRTAYPAREVAALYRDRWEAELSYRELKVHLATDKVAFRSKKPERVLQEVYGLLIAYNCVRALMCDAASEAGVRPTQISFVDTLERLRCAMAVYAGGQGDPDDLVAAVALCQLPPRRRGRRCERAVKLKYSSYPRKRKDRPAAASPYVNRTGTSPPPLPRGVWSRSGRTEPQGNNQVGEVRWTDAVTALQERVSVHFLDQHPAVPDPRLRHSPLVTPRIPDLEQGNRWLL